MKKHIPLLTKCKIVMWGKMDKIMAVNKKLPTEFQVVLVKTLLAKDKSLFNHASVQSWVSANANVIL